MRALRSNDTVVAENTPEQESGRGILSTIGERLGRIPAVSNAIRTGAMLGILGGGAVAMEGCVPDRAYPTAGSEVSPQYEMTAFALTAEELKTISTPKAMPGNTIGYPEPGEIEGKQVMIGCDVDKNGKLTGFFRSIAGPEDVYTQGVYTEIKGLESVKAHVTAIVTYGSKVYLSRESASGMSGDIKFNANGELEVSNLVEDADMGVIKLGYKLKVITVDGIPYLYGDAKRKNLLTGAIEDLPKGDSSYSEGIPVKVGEKWHGNRLVKIGGQWVYRIYQGDTFEGPAKGSVALGSATVVSKLNQGIQARTYNLSTFENDKMIVFVMWKDNGEGSYQKPYYSIFLKPKKPDPEPDPVDAGSDVPPPEDVPVPPVDAGAEVAEDVPVPPVDAGAEVAEDVPVPPVDAGVEVAEDATDTTDTSDAGEPLDIVKPPVDAGADIPPPEDVPVPVDAEDAAEVAADVPVPPVDAGADIPPPKDVPLPEDAPAPADTTDTPDAGVEVADDAAGEVAGDTSTPDDAAETLDMSQDPDAIIAEVKAEIQDDTSQQDGTADAPPDMSTQETNEDITQTPDNQTQPDTSKQPETSTGADTSGQPDNAQNPDSGLPSADSMQADSIQSADSTQPGDVISKPPKVNDGCSAGPRKSPWSINALAAYILAAVIAVYSRRRKVKKL